MKIHKRKHKRCDDCQATVVGFCDHHRLNPWHSRRRQRLADPSDVLLLGDVRHSSSASLCIFALLTPVSSVHKKELGGSLVLCMMMMILFVIEALTSFILCDSVLQLEVNLIDHGRDRKSVV